MKRYVKKLSIRREILLNLTNLGTVAGGLPTYSCSCQGPTCNDNCDYTASRCSSICP